MAKEASPQSQVQGTSKTGDFGEALALAIAEAKSKLHTDHVVWRLIDLSGESGGFVLLNDLTVTIQAEKYTSKD